MTKSFTTNVTNKMVSIWCESVDDVLYWMSFYQKCHKEMFFLQCESFGDLLGWSLY